MSAIGEAVLGAVIGELVKSLVFHILHRLQNERKRFPKFREDLDKLKSDFEFLSACLNDAQSKLENGSSAVEKWVDDLSSAVMDAEDLLEYFASASLGTVSSTNFLSFVGYYPCPFRQIRKELRKLRRKVEEIRANASVLGILVAYRQPVQLPGGDHFSVADNPSLKSSILQDEWFSVDMEDKIRDVSLMVEKFRVVSVVGMGGIGKTRLLQHVFKKLKPQYEFSLWLSVSQTFSIFQLQFDVLDKLGENDHSKASVTLRQEIIHERLNGRRCLIVMDDVWNLKDDGRSRYLNIAEELKRVGIPENDDCKILISTREQDAANAFRGNTYPMDLLSFENSMRLFRNHFRFEETANMSADKERTVKKIVKRCKGLPLAIITMARLLSDKDPSQWRELLQQFKDSKLNNFASAAVMLSYRALPFAHKLCFSYMALCPEDSDIFKYKMMRCWKAEGFVQTENESEEIWSQLCRKCLLQPQDSFYAKMHDIVRDFAVKMLRESRGACDEGSLRKQFAESGIRRISLENADIDLIAKEEQCPATLRTLFLASNRKLNKLPSEFLVNARALRVLDLCGCWNLSSLPESVGDLNILRYLDISDTSIKGIPDCVENLKFLEYLHIHSAPEGIPSWITKLLLLTTLSSFEKTYWRRASAEPMPRLKILSNIYIMIKEGRAFSKEVAGLTDLHTIALSFQSFPDDAEFWPLRELRLENSFSKKTTTRGISNAIPTLTLQDDVRCSLERLELNSIKVPAFISYYNKLQHLRLINHGKGYPTEICKLPCLLYLELSTDDESEDLPSEYGEAGAFPKLEILWIEKINKLKNLTSVIEDTAMPELRYLYLMNCHGLESLPDLKEGALPKLNLLHLEECPTLQRVGQGWKAKASSVEGFWSIKNGSVGDALQEARKEGKVEAAFKYMTLP